MCLRLSSTTEICISKKYCGRSDPVGKAVLSCFSIPTSAWSLHAAILALLMYLSGNLRRYGRLCDTVTSWLSINTRHIEEESLGSNPKRRSLSKLSALHLARLRSPTDKILLQMSFSFAARNKHNKTRSRVYTFDKSSTEIFREQDTDFFGG